MTWPRLQDDSEWPCKIISPAYWRLFDRAFQKYAGSYGPDVEGLAHLIVNQLRKVDLAIWSATAQQDDGARVISSEAQEKRVAHEVKVFLLALGDMGRSMERPDLASEIATVFLVHCLKVNSDLAGKWGMDCLLNGDWNDSPETDAVIAKYVSRSTFVRSRIFPRKRASLLSRLFSWRKR